MSGTTRQYPSASATDPTAARPTPATVDLAASQVSIPPVIAEHFDRVLAFQSEQFARYADATAQTYARQEVIRADRERQAVEDHRATRRNRNRFLALVVALLLGFLAPSICAFLHIPLQYSFCVVVLLDSGVTAYALVKHI